jgi:hypothetical protein
VSRRVLVLAVLTSACFADLGGFSDGTNPSNDGDAGDGGGIGAGGDAADGGASACADPTPYTFDPPAQHWLLLGTAVSEPPTVRLIGESQYNDKGGVFWDQPLSFAAFDVAFTFRIEHSGSAVGDGMAAAWIHAPSVPTLTNQGGNIGVHGLAGYAVVLDTFQNTGDQDTPYVALRDTTAWTDIAASPAFPKLTDANDHTIRIVLVQGALGVSVDGQKVLAATISGYVPFDGYLGVTAANGFYASTYRLSKVAMRFGSAVADCPDAGSL